MRTLAILGGLYNLIWVFAGQTGLIVGFVVCWLIFRIYKLFCLFHKLLAGFKQPHEDYGIHVCPKICNKMAYANRGDSDQTAPESTQFAFH